MQSISSVMAASTSQVRHILVTGANSGIGLALCKLLAAEHGCHVYLGCRSAEKGAAAVASIAVAAPLAKDRVEALTIDVSDDVSCAAAAEAVRAKGVKLYAVVNNAGLLPCCSLPCSLRAWVTQS